MIGYWSRQLNKAERNYSTVEREALAVVAAVKEFYPYVYGFHFTLVTDHNPLTSLKGLNDVHGRLTRWITFLQQFDFQFKYRPGGKHGNADALSRRPPEKPEVLAAILEMVSMGWEDVRVAQAQDEVLGPIMIALQRGEKMPAGLPRGLQKSFLHICMSGQKMKSNKFIQVTLAPPTTLMCLFTTKVGIVFVCACHRFSGMCVYLSCHS